jgi:molybdenum cofactor synthesis domain-containing protein
MAMGPEDMLREVKVEEAVGMVLPHDLTQIIPGQFKGRLFKKGHVIRETDIPALLSIGKEHIYAMELTEGYLHEDDAAIRLARATAGGGVKLTEPHEGKVSLKAAIHGLAKVSKPFVDEVNGIDQIVLSTIKSNTVVQPDQLLAGTRVIPLIVEQAKIAQVERIARHHAAAKDGGAGLIAVKPLRKLQVGVVTTGSEVFKGRIADKFGPIVRTKVNALGSEVIDQVLTPDDRTVIVDAIRQFLRRGADLVLVTGGMSVDPDDRTPAAIRETGAEIVSYGTPMLPGSMLMMAYLDGVPIMGLPGCVMHDPYTSFDVLLPRICAGETIVKHDIIELGYGGLLNC